jgi:hypothetical protein
MEEATFPLVRLRTEDVIINLLHGYSSNLDANSIRESLTPIGPEGSFEVLIQESDYEIKKLNYEVREFIGNELIEKGSVSVFDEENEFKTAKLHLSPDLQKEKDYAVKITLITSESRKMYYYTRIKKYDSGNLKKKLEFVMDFHNAIKDKEKAEEYSVYLEPHRTKENTSLADVNIHSSLELITWGKLEPEFITEVVPTVVENYAEIASFVLEYVVKAKVSDIPEFYKVKEYYRVRYTPGRTYLLNYERRMEALFDTDLTNVSMNQLKLGITSNLDIPYLAGPDKMKFAFVRNRELWFYDLEENKIVRIFSFRQNKTDYIRDIYDQHDIRILNMDAEGNVNFMVYGYMNRGQYEGRVAIVLYKYIRADQRIEELVYIPVDEPYQRLKENMGELSYINNLDIFYFHIYDSIYSYDMITKQLTKLASNVAKDNILDFSKEGYFVWQESDGLGYSNNINIMNLETGDIQKIDSRPGYKIVLLDMIDLNLIYGFVAENDITTMIDGRVIIPMNRIEIASLQNEILKSYNKEGYYITGVEVKDNIVELYRSKKGKVNGKDVYVSSSSDYIMNRIVEKTPFISVVPRVSEAALTEYYIQLPSEFDMDKEPKMLTTVNTIISDDPTLRLPKDGENISNEKQYYAYIMGELEETYKEAAEAINAADQGAGVVLSSLNHLVWERGVNASRINLSKFETMDFSASSNSLESCIKLMAKYLGKNIDNKTLDLKDTSALEILNKDLKVEPIRLTGSTLDQVLYYINKGRPVIAMTGYNDAILIYGYDAYNIYMIDPKQGKSVKIGLQDSRDLFENAGNIFISYLD